MSALLDIYITETKLKKRNNLYIHCDVCGESILDGENLLRMVKAQKIANWTQAFDTPQYVSVNKSEIRDLEIYITDDQGNLASFLKQPVTITFHFKAYPFYD